MTTLDDLKRAIDSFQAELNHPRWDDRYDLQLSRAKAWRAAFEWRENVLSRVSFAESYDTCNGVPLDVLRAERDDGMALIREKLK